MDALRILLGRPVAPFGDLPRDLDVLGTTLGGSQARALHEAGVRLREGDPPNAPWLAIADHLWVTAPLVRAFLQACPPTGGQLQVAGPFWAFTQALQDAPDGRLPLWLVPGGPATPERLAELPPVPVDLAETTHLIKLPHPLLTAAHDRPLPVTDAMAHTISHWSHLLRVNWLALIAFAEGERRKVDAAPLRKAWALLSLFARSESLDAEGVAAALTRKGKGCRIHRTAVVEACLLEDGVEIGPHAVVRNSWLGAGAIVAEQARVVSSVLGARASVAHGASLNLCLLMPGAHVGQGFGHQACVFGRGAFVAEGVTTYDLSFGGEIQVRVGDERVGSGTRFLGSAIGHGARIGPHVRLGYGEEVPNDAFLVGDPDTIARKIPARLGRAPHVVRNGRVVPLQQGGGIAEGREGSAKGREAGEEGPS